MKGWQISNGGRILGETCILRREEEESELRRFYLHPVKFRGTACSHFPALLEKIYVEQLFVSLLCAEHLHQWDDVESASDPTRANVAASRQTLETFKASLTVSEEKYLKTEHDTKLQRNLGA